MCLQNPSFPNQNIIIKALVTPLITPVTLGKPNTFIQNLMINKGFQIADSYSSDIKIHVLIGADYLNDIFLEHKQKITRNLIASETIFGWVVQGRTHLKNDNKSSDINPILTACQTSENNDLISNKISSLWETELMGIQLENEIKSELDDEVIKKFEAELRYNSNRYKVKLPWKSKGNLLMDNYENSINRLKGLVRRFFKNPELYNEYKTVISGYIDLGIIEEIPNPEGKFSLEYITYYLPHHPVIKRDKETTSLRIVFDASSHMPGSPSLNDLLESGPNLNTDLLILLLRFRLNEIAFVADIEKAYLQIELSEEDRDAVRFLWINELPKDINKLELITFRLKRVLFGCTSSQFLLAAVLRHHFARFQNKYSRTCKILQESFYVDDLITGSSNVEDALKICQESKEILKMASMTLRKWKTNSSILRNYWIKENLENSSDCDSKIETNQLSFTKILGLIWDTENDSFSLSVGSLLEFLSKQESTKRTIIRAFGRVFDPLGFVSPFIIRVKILFQELWERKIEWDEMLPTDIARKWDSWREELEIMKDLNIPRHYFKGFYSLNITNIQIHAFSDASNKAYGCVLYMRYIPENGTPHVVFIASKGRVAPLKKLTIPRLELMGSLIAARFMKHIIPAFENYQIKKFFWVDSKVVLSWIRSNSTKWKQFVGSRIQEIQNLTNIEEWRYCPGPENPADMITRGRSLYDLRYISEWWRGPQWLKLNEEYWPQCPEIYSNIEENEECKKITSLIMLSDQPTLLNFENYSRLSKLMRTTAWILRFAKNIKSTKEDREYGTLTIDELDAAEIYLIKEVQRSVFSNEINALLKENSVENNSKIKDLDPYLDSDGVLRVRSRLKCANLTYDEKYPILLPCDHHFSKLVVMSSHERNAHLGLSATITDVRARFWILRARQLAKKIIRNCNVCKFFHSKPFSQKTAPLPSDRINIAPAFEVTGIDFAGPLYFKDIREVKKCYICLFTCATTRAVHLELITDLTAESFILAFKRFIGRRALPKIIHSDNARTFQKAEKEFKSLFEEKNIKTLKEYFGNHKIEWKFITPLAPWTGGFWERMVKTVKGCLKKTIGRAQLKFAELETVLVQIEAVVNSRPLTFIYNDLHEPVPLTPSDFLVGKRLISLPDRKGKSSVRFDHKGLEKRFRYQQTLLNSFWDKWKKQYLLDLRSNHHISSKVSSVEPKVGNIVLLEEKRLPRLLWKFGVITELFRGRDNKVRSCQLRLPDGSFIKRHIKMLYPIEVQNSDNLI